MISPPDGTFPRAGGQSLRALRHTLLVKAQTAVGSEAPARVGASPLRRPSACTHQSACTASGPTNSRCTHEEPILRRLRSTGAFLRQRHPSAGSFELGLQVGAERAKLEGELHAEAGDNVFGNRDSDDGYAPVSAC